MLTTKRINRIKPKRNIQTTVMPEAKLSFDKWAEYIQDCIYIKKP